VHDHHRMRVLAAARAMCARETRTHFINTCA
jgi:hypothetical protein